MVMNMNENTINVMNVNENIITSWIKTWNTRNQQTENQNIIIKQNNYEWDTKRYKRAELKNANSTNITSFVTLPQCSHGQKQLSN